MNYSEDLDSIRQQVPPHPDDRACTDPAVPFPANELDIQVCALFDRVDILVLGRIPWELKARCHELSILNGANLPSIRASFTIPAIIAARWEFLSNAHGQTGRFALRAHHDWCAATWLVAIVTVALSRMRDPAQEWPKALAVKRCYQAPYVQSVAAACAWTRPGMRTMGMPPLARLIGDCRQTVTVSDGARRLAQEDPPAVQHEFYLPRYPLTGIDINRSLETHEMVLGKIVIEKTIAVSHAWLSTPVVPTAEIRGISGTIVTGTTTESLLLLLAAARELSHGAAEWLWIDQLAYIGATKDVKEDGVRGMGWLYSQAWGVVVLPQGARMCTLAPPEMTIAHLVSNRWEVSAWHSRVWTLQEPALARRLFVCFGVQHDDTWSHGAGAADENFINTGCPEYCLAFSLEEVVTVVVLRQLFGPESSSLAEYERESFTLHQRTLRRVLQQYCRFSANGSLAHFGRCVEDFKSLSNPSHLMRIVREREVSPRYPCDRVYSILGLLPGGNRVPADQDAGLMEAMRSYLNEAPVEIRYELFATSHPEWLNREYSSEKPEKILPLPLPKRSFHWQRFIGFIPNSSGRLHWNGGPDFTLSARCEATTLGDSKDVYVVLPVWSQVLAIGREGFPRNPYGSSGSLLSRISESTALRRVSEAIKTCSYFGEEGVANPTYTFWPAYLGKRVRYSWQNWLDAANQRLETPTSSRAVLVSIDAVDPVKQAGHVEYAHAGYFTELLAYMQRADAPLQFEGTISSLCDAYAVWRLTVKHHLLALGHVSDTAETTQRGQGTWAFVVATPPPPHTSAATDQSTTPTETFTMLGTFSGNRVGGSWTPTEVDVTILHRGGGF